jgi:hypothetical protein
VNSSISLDYHIIITLDQDRADVGGPEHRVRSQSPVKTEASHRMTPSIQVVGADKRHWDAALLAAVSREVET